MPYIVPGRGATAAPEVRALADGWWARARWVGLNSFELSVALERDPPTCQEHHVMTMFLSVKPSRSATALVS